MRFEIIYMQTAKCCDQTKLEISTKRVDDYIQFHLIFSKKILDQAEFLFIIQFQTLQESINNPNKLSTHCTTTIKI